MARLFGTDGVRGIANDSLTPELAYHLGRAAAYIFGQNKEHPTFLIGRDTRRSGTMLADILAAGIASAGGDCYMVGVIPTPAIAYLTRTHHMDAGVMISASHNPFEYNGIKFFDGFGYKLPDETEDKIEECMLKDERAALQSRPTGAAIGTISAWTDLQQEYADFICKSTDIDLSGLKVVHDGANGSASVLGPEILKRLGAEVIAIHHEPNGVNINEKCGSTHLESLKETVLKYGADVGIANDGDADRCLCVDEKGNVITGDHILYIYGCYMKERGKLMTNTVVTTVMSNFGLYKAFDEQGIGYAKTAVGDKYVYEYMARNGCRIGGEQSGHIIFSKYASTGDGILTSLKMMEVMLAKKKPMSELAAPLKIYPQVLTNVKVTDKRAAQDDADVQAAVKAVAEALGDTGRILVRESGTEPLVRVMVEAPEHETCEKYVAQVVDVIKAKGYAL